MNLRERLTLRFTDRVISTPEGRAHRLDCHGISRRYAPDGRTRTETLDEQRRLEARCFAENGRANMQHLFDRGWVAVGSVEKWFWKAINGLSIRGELPLTAFAHSEVAS